MNVKAGGSGEQADVDLVAARLLLIPQAIRDDLHARGIGVIACRESVIDYRPDMATLLPRNWPAGLSWEVVPGCYIPAERTIVIATLGEGTERRIPARGEKHGSCDLVIHETMHADDYVIVDNEWRRRSDNAGFIAARTADIEAGGFADYPYEAKETEETYAESAARWFGEDPAVGEQWPELARFWETAVLPIEVGATRRAAHSHAESIGTAKQNDDASYALDLVASSEDGIIGHALVVLRPGDPAYDRVDERFRGRRGLEAAEETMILSPF